MTENGWPEIPLGAVLTERQETPDPVAIESGMIRIVSKIGFNTGSIEYRSNGRTNTKMIAIHPGDLVLSGINAAKGAIAIYPESEDQLAAATIHYGAYGVQEKRANRKFLWWLLRSRTFKDILARHLPGGIKTELKAKRLLPIPIPLPSVPEQERIVATLETLVGRIRKAQMLCDESRKEASALVKANLNEISERLSPIKGILRDILTDNPRNGWSARCDNDIDGIPILTLSAVTGFYYTASAIKRTSLPTDPVAHYWLQKGDLLITRSNTPDLVGHAAIYSGEPYPCIYPDLMMRLPINERLAKKEFVWFWLQTPLVRDYVKANAKGTSPTMKKINQGTVMNIPYPTGLDIPEQRELVRHLNGLRTKTVACQEHQDEIAVELHAMLPSILDKVFKGELW